MRWVLSLFLLLFLSACSNTWSGIKTDTKESVDWTKGKINDGATYIKEKTE